MGEARRRKHSGNYTSHSPKQSPILSAFAINNLIETVCPIAVDAHEFTRRGGDFSGCQTQMIVNDEASAYAFEMTVRIFGHAAKAFYICPTGFGGTSVEVLFDDDAGDHALDFYSALPERISPAIVNRIAAKHPELKPMLERVGGCEVRP